MDWAFFVCTCASVYSKTQVRGARLTKLDTRVEPSVRAEQVQSSLAIVTLSCLVNLGLCQYDQARSGVIPLHLHLVAFEEVLLRHSCSELRDVKDFDRSGLTLKPSIRILGNSVE
jgi:hypothetical protein